MFKADDSNLDVLTRQQLSSLLHASWLVNCETRCRERLQILEEQIRQLLQCERCFLFVYNHKRDSLITHPSQRFPDHFLESLLVNYENSNDSTSNNRVKRDDPQISINGGSDDQTGNSNNSVNVSVLSSSQSNTVILTTAPSSSATNSLPSPPTYGASQQSDFGQQHQRLSSLSHSGTDSDTLFRTFLLTNSPSPAEPNDALTLCTHSKEFPCHDDTCLEYLEKDECMPDIYHSPSELLQGRNRQQNHPRASSFCQHNNIQSSFPKPTNYSPQGVVIRIKVFPDETFAKKVLSTGQSDYYYNPAGTAMGLQLCHERQGNIDHRISATSAAELLVHRRKCQAVRNSCSPMCVAADHPPAETAHKSHNSSPHLKPTQVPSSLSSRNDQHVVASDSKDLLKFWVFSSLAVPVVDDRGILAVFNKISSPTQQQPTAAAGEQANAATDKKFCEFTKNDEIMLGYFATIVGETLNSADLLKNAELSRDRATGLLNLLQSFKHNLSIQSALLTLTTHAKHLVGASECVVYAIVRKNKETPYLLTLCSDSGKELKLALSPNNSILFNCANGKMIVINDARGSRELEEMSKAMAQENLVLASPHLSSTTSPSNSTTTNPSRSPTISSTPVNLSACPISAFPLLGNKKLSGQGTGSASDTDSDVSNSRRLNSGHRSAPFPFANPINNLAVVPIKAENQTTIGLIQLANKMDDDGDYLPFTDDDLRILDMFCSLVGPKLERSEFGLRATGGKLLTEAGRANNPPTVERSRRPSLSTPSEPVIHEEESDHDIDAIDTVSGYSDISPRSGSLVPIGGSIRKASSLERLA